MAKYGYRFAALAFLLSPSLAWCGGGYLFKSSNYVALISDHCGYGVLDCKNVEYFGVNRKTGASIYLKGNSLLSGQAPNWVGYQFKSGNADYQLYVDYDKAELRVFQGAKEILSEHGEFSSID